MGDAKAEMGDDVYLQEHCGPEPGDWITMKTNIGTDPQKYCLAIGHRRGPAVHTFVSTHGQTTPGKPQAATEEIDDSGKTPEPRKCPKVLNDYTNGQLWIDMGNRNRQEILAIEEAFRTDSFPFRMLTSLIGMWASNSYLASKYFHNEQRSFREYVHALSMALMKNTIDGDLRSTPSPTPSTSSTSSEPHPRAQSGAGYQNTQYIINT